MASSWKPDSSSGVEYLAETTASRTIRISDIAAVSYAVKINRLVFVDIFLSSATESRHQQHWSAVDQQELRNDCLFLRAFISRPAQWSARMTRHKPFMLRRRHIKHRRRLVTVNRNLFTLCPLKMHKVTVTK